MALTAVQTAYLKTRLGSTLDAADLEARFARLGTVEKVAVEVLEERLATFLASPLKFTIPGDYSEDKTDNVAHVRDMLEKAQTEAGVNPAASTLRAVLPATGRWGR